MSTTNFNTSNKTYRELIGNGHIYSIPSFQRDYSWDEEQWDDLWQDILEVTSEKNDTAHYMGYLVLQSDNSKSFDVIDGQQRLTTLSIVVLSVLKNLSNLVSINEDSANNQQRYDEIRRTYIGSLDSVTLISKTKLTLNRNNDNYFQNYIVPLRPLPVRGFKSSEHLLRKSFEWFDRKVQEFLKGVTTNKGEALAGLVERMAYGLFFTIISVTDELNAYKVFETLNARGVKLSSTDLLKNYLFSVIHRENQDQQELRVLENRWESIVSRLGSESFPDFLRAHWVSRFKSVRHAELYKAVRSTISNRQSVFELLRGMEEDVDAFLSITSPESSQWSPPLKKLAEYLKMFSVRQPTPLLIAAHRKLDNENFSLVLKACVIISFRYNVICGLHTNDQEKIYQIVAQKISSEDYKNGNEVIAAMKTIYPNDNTFKSSFSEKILNTTNTRNGRIVRYILAEIEKQETNVDIDFMSDKYSIEHVLPQNPEFGWEDFTDAEVEAMVYRLGNMALLEKGINREIENKPFIDKKPKLETSIFVFTKNISHENAEWTSERITARQNKLANIATTVWRLNQLA
ncbi:MAG: DUF262 domain-containing HNH endonuclease family protein [Methylophilus sp.]|nr:DUF262 domain-containing HNH endonuclease family protein [Methylophilus sp.]